MLETTHIDFSFTKRLIIFTFSCNPLPLTLFYVARRGICKSIMNKYICNSKVKRTCIIVIRWVPWRLLLDDIHWRNLLGVCNIWYPSETHLNPKFREISFAHSIRFSCPIVLTLCTEHGSDTAILCAKFQIDWVIEQKVMGKRDFTRFGFKMHFGRISYIAQSLWRLPLRNAII